MKSFDLTSNDALNIREGFCWVPAKNDQNNLKASGLYLKTK